MINRVRIIICICLAVILVLPCIYSADPLGSAKTKTILVKGYPTTEYERAVFYGFIKDGVTEKKAAKKKITYKQFCVMVGKMIKKYKSENLSAWNKMTRKAPKKKMKRDAAVIALLYAGEAVGLNFANSIFHENSYDFYNVAHKSYPVFDVKKPAVSCVDMTMKDDPHSISRLDDASFIYVSRRRSCISGQSLLEPNSKGDWHVLDYLTYRDAALAVVRLYESDESVAIRTAEYLLEKVKETPGAKEIIEKADARREAIRSSKTEIVKSSEYIPGKTYTGTAYYLSNKGDDSNSGTSEKSPWKTIDRLLKVHLKYGDAVFFERGSTWNGARWIPYDEGVTFSAYGEGPKPVISGSTENSAAAEKWSLFYEGEDGRKIWKYYKKVPETGVIVFDDGKSYAKRDTPFWDGSNYRFVDDYRLQETYDVKKHLSNLQYFPALEYAENPMDPYKVFLKSDYNSDTSSWEYITGDLYLRCDEGNPGEVFSDIQMSTPSSMFDGVKNYCTVDNLCVAYSIQTLCGGGDPNDGPNHHVTFQNCEAKWMGGGVYYYRDDYHAYMMCGGAFNCSGSNETVLNCYAHHCFQEGVTLEAFDYYDGMIENIRFEGNLTEYCLMGNMFTNWDTSNRESHLFKDVIYRDNMVLYSGFENLYTMKKMIDGEKNEYKGDIVPYDCRAFGLTSEMNGLNAFVGSFDVSGNTFAFAIGKLIEISTFTDRCSRVFSGNTYAQLPGFSWLTYYGVEGTDDRAQVEMHRHRYMTDPKKAILEKLQDITAKIVSF